MESTILPWLFVLLYLLAMALLVLACVRHLRELRVRRPSRRAPAAVPAAAPVQTPAEATAMAPLLAAHGLGRWFADRAGATITVLEDVSLTIAAGELVAVVGPSGGGKSTLLNLLAGIDLPSAGAIAFRGEPLPRREGEALRRHRERNVSLVFQDHNLLSFQTAAENAALPLLLLGWPRPAALARAQDVLARLGLAELGHRYPHQLSGGQQQRVAIARALTSPAPLILADEPTGSLDLDNAERVMAAFAAAARELGRAVLLVTHNPELAARYCDRLLECTGRALRPVMDEQEPELARVAS